MPIAVTKYVALYSISNKIDTHTYRLIYGSSLTHQSSKQIVAATPISAHELPTHLPPPIAEIINAVNHNKQSNMSRMKFAFRLAHRLNRCLCVVRYWYSRKRADLIE